MNRPLRRTAALVAALLLSPAAPALALGGAPASVAASPTGPCPDEDGVTVVVDFTDVGGEVEVGCAPGAPETGTAALLAAGFTEERAESGLLCAISDRPDPCPTEFDGNWWSYWSAEPGGEWVSYDVGPDEAVPVPGTVEGWRYSDGEQGPTVEPPAPGSGAAAGADDGATQGSTGDTQETPEDATDDPADETTEAEDTTAADEPQAGATGDEEATTSTPLLLGGAVVVLAAIAAVALSRRRRDPNGPPGQH